MRVFQQILFFYINDLFEKHLLKNIYKQNRKPWAWSSYSIAYSYLVTVEALKYSIELKVLRDVVTWACNPAAFKGKFRNGVDSKQTGVSVLQ